MLEDDFTSKKSQIMGSHKDHNLDLVHIDINLIKMVTLVNYYVEPRKIEQRRLRKGSEIS
jgi:hypothetical protein